ncbi:MAG: hypothetical protein ACP6IY_09480 [Promethearchaeia archaeon]
MEGLTKTKMENKKNVFKLSKSEQDLIGTEYKYDKIVGSNIELFTEKSIKKRMKKPITIKLPKCAKCGKTLEPQFTTEQREEDKGKPKFLIMFGDCDKCKIRTVCNVIETKELTFVKSKDEVKKDE